MNLPPVLECPPDVIVPVVEPERDDVGLRRRMPPDKQVVGNAAYRALEKQVLGVVEEEPDHELNRNGLGCGHYVPFCSLSRCWVDDTDVSLG